MNTNDNTPTMIVQHKATPMSDGQEAKQKCKFCGDDEGGIAFVAIFTDDSEEPKEYLFLCENHYRTLVKSREYRVRELPEEVELGHTAREEVSEGSDDFVTILRPENENKWLQVPDELETDLKDKR